MRDNGPRHSFRVRRGRFFLMLAFFACLPLVCGVLGWQTWRLWQENRALRENVLRFESDYQTAQATAERLENLEELLREEGVQGRELVLRKLASAEQAETPPQASGAEAASAPEGAPAMSEGPGHEEFPAIDTGYVRWAMYRPAPCAAASCALPWIFVMPTLRGWLPARCWRPW